MSSASTDLSRLRIERGEGRPPGRRRRAAWIPILLVAALVVAGSAFMKGRQRVEVRTAIASVRGVGQAGPAAASITANGYVVARTKASISSKITGRLEFLGVSEGSTVEEGAVIARLESADYRAEVDAREASLALAKATLTEYTVTRDQLRRDLARSETLRKSDLVSEQETEQLRARLEEADARLASQAAQAQAMSASLAVARANLENTIIRAPFAGTVLRKDAEVGELVAPSVSGGGLTRGAVVTMANLATLEVEVDVNEAYIARIAHEQRASITLDAYPDTTFQGSVRQVMPTADRQRATVQVKVSILDHDPRILPEMGARVAFLEEAPAADGAPARPRVVVPATAVRQDGGGAVVWVVRDGRLEPRTVDAGPVSGGEREVKSGLSGGETIVIEGPDRLEAGQRVKVR